MTAMNNNQDPINYEVYDEIPVEKPGEHPLEEKFKALKNPPTTLLLTIFLFILGFFGLTYIGVLYQEIIKFNLFTKGLSEAEILAKINSLGVLSMTNFIRYSVTLTLMAFALYVAKVLKPILNQFTKFRTYLYGVGYGFIAIFLSVSYNLLVALIFKDPGSNQNQNLVEEVIKLNPLLSLLWIPFFGPIVEELTYRLGLFESLHKFNRIVAYVVTGLFFGLIHFNLPSSGDPNYNRLLLIEFVNLPSYILSGLLFNYIYEKENLGTSMVAHITNNLVSYIATIISINS